MTTVTTNRMKLRPMSLEDFNLLLTDISALEAKWNCTYSGQALQEMKPVFSEMAVLLQKHPDDWIFNTIWMMVYCKTNTIIGSLCFKGSPDDDGCVEIGYGIGQLYEGHGFTSEVNTALSRFALQQSEVKAVIAETEKWNIASQRVLQKCGMHRYKETDTAYWWKLLPE